MGEQGYRKTTSDHCVFVQKFSDDDFVILLLYVDDILIVGRNVSRIDNLKKQLSKSFAMKDLGPVKRILGIRIERDRASKKLCMLQEQYIEKVFARFNMSKAKVVSSPLARRHEKSSDALAVGSLMYAMVCTRPDIAYAVGVVSGFIESRRHHWEAIKVRFTGVVPHAKDIAPVRCFTSSSLLAKTTKLCILALRTFPLPYKYREASGTISQEKNGVCEISQTLKRAAKYFRNTKLSLKGCEVGFHHEGDFAALCKMLPSARSDWFVTAATSSFQLRIAHRLKHWIVDFLSFEMVYSMHHLDFRKCSKSGCYDCHQEYASWQILFAFILAIRIYSWQMTSKLCPRFLIALLSLDLLW
ncbi:hypothetical protein AAG906_003923 [Vitis piasezkii]